LIVFFPAVALPAQCDVSSEAPETLACGEAFRENEYSGTGSERYIQRRDSLSDCIHYYWLNE